MNYNKDFYFHIKNKYLLTKFENILIILKKKMYKEAFVKKINIYQK